MFAKVSIQVHNHFEIRLKWDVSKPVGICAKTERLGEDFHYVCPGRNIFVNCFWRVTVSMHSKGRADSKALKDCGVLNQKIYQIFVGMGTTKPFFSQATDFLPGGAGVRR